jgi:ABC-type molybdate transport system substrate-binding protein
VKPCCPPRYSPPAPTAPCVRDEDSLREVIGEIGHRYQIQTGIEVRADFGPSGVLRERIENGEKADLFASADMGHPLKLAAAGLAIRVDMFTRNALCAFARPKVGVTPANFLDSLLDPAVRLGTSTPKADPAGDYTWLMFQRADGVHPGAFSILGQKAQKIFGAPQNNVPVKEPAVEALTTGKVDIVIGYCSGRQHMLQQLLDLSVVEVPKEIAAGSEYGLVG